MPDRAALPLGSNHRSRARAFWMLALAAFALRLLAAPWFAHSGDLNAFIAWGLRLADVGPARFWTADYWCDYLPGYLLILQVLGELAAWIPRQVVILQVPAASGIAAKSLSIDLHYLLFKLPNILADIATAYLIWRLTREKLGRQQLWLPALYLANPAVWLNSTLWGQADSLHAFGLLGGLYLLTRRRVVWAGLLLGYALAIKPHSLVLLPIALVFALRQQLPIWRVAIATALAPAVFAATFLPFNSWQVRTLVGFIRDRFTATMGEYGHASVNAMNLWYLTGHNWEKDTTPIIWGLTILHFAYALCSIGLLTVLLRYLLQRRDATSGLWEATGLAYLVVFLFVTRAHERHVFPYFALLAPALAWRRAAVVPWVLLSGTYCVNLLFAWRYLLPGHQSAELCAPALGILICALNLAVLPLTLVACHRWGNRAFLWLTRGWPTPSGVGARSGSGGPILATNLPIWPWAERHGRLALAGIMLFALTTRLVRLNEPPERYFDEVYHPYTAEQWVKGNTDAWLWSKKAPDKGCSYEWTHPPLAKLLMQYSMEVFGIHPWAWRLPGALFGALGVLLIYGIALSLFRHRGVALLYGALAALDILPLFAARIGMNDVYCVTFILLAVLLALQPRWVLLAPVAVALALASKWTALYALPLLGFIHLLLAPRESRRPIGRLAFLASLYLIVVPALYLGSYIPFFRAGHNWPQFFEVQRQMWCYHTGLTATHAFSSPAWTWPLLSKAVWCYIDKVPSAQPAPSASAQPAASASPVASGERVKPRRPLATSSAKAASDRTDTTNTPAAKPPPPKYSASVYAWGNPIIWIAGLGAILFGVYHLATARDVPVLITVAGYLAFWAPWLASPRIMFLYHYLPSLPFLYITLAWAVAQTRLQSRTIKWLLGSAAVAFVLLYPFVTAIYLPHKLTPAGR